MKLAISNIAWNPDEEGAVFEKMLEYGVTGLEIAPTKLWQNPLATGDEEIARYREFCEMQGISIVSMQALLFGHPELTIFESETKREATIEYLSGIIRLAGLLGVGPLVFGSPKNRQCGDMPAVQRDEIKTEFFYRIAEIALENNTVFCIEPNPVAYGCDFITNSKQGAELVRTINHPGFGLHLDAAGMSMSNEDLEPAITSSFDVVRHFHISEPYLDEIGTGGVDHETIAAILRKLGYSRWLSIEMKSKSEKNNLPAVEAALRIANQYYCS